MNTSRNWRSNRNESTWRVNRQGAQAISVEGLPDGLPWATKETHKLEPFTGHGTTRAYAVIHTFTFCE